MGGKGPSGCLGRDKSNAPPRDRDGGRRPPRGRRVRAVPRSPALRALDSLSGASSQSPPLTRVPAVPVPDLCPSPEAPARGGRRTPSGPRKRWTPPAGAERRLFTLEQAACYLSVSPWTVRDLQWAGRLPRVNLSRKLLFDRADLDALIDREKER